MSGFASDSGSSGEPAARVSRWPTRGRLAELEQAITTAVGSPDQLIASVPRGFFDRGFRRAHRERFGRLGLGGGAIAVTDRRLLLLGVRRGEVRILAAPVLGAIRVIEYRTNRWRGGEDYVDWFLMRIGDESLKFTFSHKWTKRGAAVVEALGGCQPVPARP